MLVVCKTRTDTRAPLASLRAPGPVAFMGIVMVLGSECCVVSPSDTGRPSDRNDRRCCWDRLCLLKDPFSEAYDAGAELRESSPPTWSWYPAPQRTTNWLCRPIPVDDSRPYPVKRHVNVVEKPQEARNKATHHTKTKSNLLKG